MRQLLMASAALLGLALAAPAFAQTGTNGTATTGSTPTPPAATAPMAGDNVAMPKHHMGINSPANSAAMADAKLGTDDSPRRYMHEAQQELARHHTALAEDALQRAETRLLDRSTLATAAGMPDNAPLIQTINQARDAIMHRDWQQAQQSIQTALANPSLTGQTSGANATATTPVVTGMEGSAPDMPGRNGLTDSPAAAVGANGTTMTPGTATPGTAMPATTMPATTMPGSTAQ